MLKRPKLELHRGCFHFADLMYVKHIEITSSVIEALVLSMMAYDSYIISQFDQWLYGFKDSPYYSRKAKQIANAIDADNKALKFEINSLCESCIKRGYDSKYNRLPETFIKNIENAITDSESMIQPVLDELLWWLDDHIPTSGKCAPRDLTLLSGLAYIIVIYSIACSLYEYAGKCYPMMLKNDTFRFLHTDKQCNRLDQLYHAVPWVNKFGTPLELNLMGILSRPELIGTITKDSSVYEGGFIPQIRDILVSTTFLDRLFYMRDGIDPCMREVQDSLLIKDNAS